MLIPSVDAPPVARDDPELASYLRIEERELRATRLHDFVDESVTPAHTSEAEIGR